MSSQDPQVPRRYRDHSVGQGKFVPSSRPAPPRFRRDSVDPESNEKRKGISPGLLILFALMGLYAAYITGNLPQADAIFNSSVDKVHTNNDQVVNSIMSSGEIILIVGAGLVLLLIIFLIRNNARRRESESD